MDRLFNAAFAGGGVVAYASVEGGKCRLDIAAKGRAGDVFQLDGAIGLRRTKRGETANGPLVVEKWPLFLLAALSSTATLFVQQAVGALATIERYPLIMRLGNAAAIVHYLRGWIWPVDLAVHYPLPPEGLSISMAWGGTALLLGLSAGAYLAWRRDWKFWGMGWLWFLVTLTPMIGLVQVGGQAWADRYTYLPHIGLTVALVWGLGTWVERAPRQAIRRWAVVATLVVLFILILRSPMQTAIWRDSESLFSHALVVTEQDELAHGALGFFYAKEGRIEEAIPHLKAALEIQPSNLRALNNLAWVWLTDPQATPRQVEAGIGLARRAAGQVRRAKKSGHRLEAGVEAAVMNTLDLAELLDKNRHTE
jgi:tetratricopeptide (TPR) repeat protein